MRIEHEKLLAIRFAETQSEWRRLEDRQALDAFLAEAGCPMNQFLTAELTMLYTGPVSSEPKTWGGVKALYR